MHTRGRKWNDFDAFFIVGQRRGNKENNFGMENNFFITRVQDAVQFYRACIDYYSRKKYFRDKSQLVTQVYY